MHYQYVFLTAFAVAIVIMSAVSKSIWIDSGALLLLIEIAIKMNYSDHRKASKTMSKTKLVSDNVFSLS